MSSIVALRATHASPLPRNDADAVGSTHGSTVDDASLVKDGDVILRTATMAEAAAIHSLIVEHLAEGHLLSRELEEIAVHTHRFVVAVHHGEVVACAELAPLSADVAEVRSAVVGRGWRSAGLGTQILDELVRRARVEGFDRLCAFTHAPAYFVHRGFSIVPHVWLPEKISTDCRSCANFRRCGQYAVVRSLHG